MTGTYRENYQALGAAQKGAARSAPAYSRFVNRRLGRLLAAGAVRAGLTPNQVTGVSAVFTFTAIAALVLVAPSWWSGILVGLALVVGYAFDSADGQVARLTKTGGPGGEWLDHVVDSVKVVSLPLAVMVGWYRFDTHQRCWLVVPLVHAVVSSVLFFAMILTEQLRRSRGVVSKAAVGGRAPWLRSVLVVPTDYGILCLLFFAWGATGAFAVGYTLVVAATMLFLAAALVRWFREVRALPAVSKEGT
ncbi:MAG: CDP-alcohol phosphatidyltransferase family protein [Micrococcales bacterium]|nr:CDP-alcohol phosphatidyltransferase family protein [Micrococcales bacterium]MCL2667324.1 CDP-alcohol phosphatidyltransferase family protein [Micrococcales bacterium]